MNDEDLVYSTAQKGQDLSKKKSKGGQAALAEVEPGQCTLKLQYEKKGRGGKGVSLVLELPHNPPYFKRLMKELKTRLGTGGAYKEEGPTAHLEFQGNRLEDLRGMLVELGFKVKG
ncbi:MAG: translation initiation factor [bacterium]|nr:translation initiation factor [bacterium]